MIEIPQEFIQDLRERYGVPGLGVVLVQNSKSENEGKPDLKTKIGTYGIANAQGDKVDEQSLFGIASNSKFFAALAVGLLIEDGTKLPNGKKLDWNTKLKDIFPEWRLPVSGGSGLADVIDLLTMRTGMPRHDDAKATVPASELIKVVGNLKPSAEFRQTYQYNNWNYHMAAWIIPTLTGKPYPQFMKERIFDPCGMSDATFNVIEALKTGHRTDGFTKRDFDPRRSVMSWEKDKKMSKVQLGEAVPFGWYTEGDGVANAGAGGIILSLRDIAKWIQELLDPKVLPKALIEKCGYPYISDPGSKDPEMSVAAYGLGLRSWSYRGRKVVSHGGGIPGQLTFLIRAVDGEFGLMVAANDNDVGNELVGSITNRMLDDLLGLEHVDWETRYFEKWVDRNKPKDDEASEKDSGASTSHTASLAGLYSCPYYGDLDLRELSTAGASSGVDDGQFKAIRLALEGVGAKAPYYISPLPKIFTSHIVFSPINGRKLKWTLIQLLPALNEKREKTGESLFRVNGTGTAYLDDKGIGMFGNFYGAGGSVEIKQAEEKMGHVDDECEVWFEKV